MKLTQPISNLALRAAHLSSVPIETVTLCLSSVVSVVSLLKGSPGSLEGDSDRHAILIYGTKYLHPPTFPLRRERPHSCQDDTYAGIG